MNIAQRPSGPRAYTLTVVSLSAVGLFILGFALSEVFNPLLLALLLAYILNPLVEALEVRGVSRRVAVPAIFAFFLLSLVALLTFGGFKASQHLLGLGSKLSGERVLEKDDPLDLELIRGSLTPPPGSLVKEEAGVHFLDRDGDGKRKVGVIERASLALGPLLSSFNLNPQEGVKLAQRLRGRASALNQVGKEVLDGLKRSFSQLGVLLSYGVLVPLYTFFLLQSFTSFRLALRQHLPGRYRQGILDIVLKIDRQVAAFFRGKLLVVLLKGVVTWLGLWLAGVPFSFLLGMGAGLASVVPLVGPLGGGALALLLSYEGPEGFLLQCVGVVCAFGFAEVVEGIAQPLILGREVGLHPLVLIISFFIFGKLFGLFGVLLAVPCASVVKTLFCELVLPEIQTLAGERHGEGGEEAAPSLPPPHVPTFPSRRGDAART